MNVYGAEVLSKNQLTSKLYELIIKLKTPEAFTFKAGQCVGFVIAENKKKLYSITSTPEQKDHLGFLIDVSPMGEGSKFVLNLEKGSSMDVEGPYGGFIVKDNSKDLLFVATGAGVAPFKSMIEDCLKNGYPKEITLLYGVRSEEDRAYFDYFQTLSHEYTNFIFMPAMSQPKNLWNGFTGRVTAYLEQNIEAYKNHSVFICGAPNMIKDVRTLLMNNGWEAKDIKLEIFV